MGWRWDESLEKLWNLYVVFKLCTLPSHESFLKTQIPGLHDSRIGWLHSLWTDRMAEWTILVHNCPLFQALCHHSAVRLNVKGPGKRFRREQTCQEAESIALLQGHCLVFFRLLSWSDFHQTDRFLSSLNFCLFPR